VIGIAPLIAQDFADYFDIFVGARPLAHRKCLGLVRSLDLSGRMIDALWAFWR